MGVEKMVAWFNLRREAGFSPSHTSEVTNTGEFGVITGIDVLDDRRWKWGCGAGRRCPTKQKVKILIGQDPQNCHDVLGVREPGPHNLSVKEKATQ